MSGGLASDPMLKETILAVALALKPWHGDTETPEERQARVEVITDAIVAATDRATCTGQPEGCKPVWGGSRSELGYLLLTQAVFETHLALHVHQGACRAHECDSGRAISLWQLHAGYHLPVERWRTLAGTDLDATTRAAWEAAVALSRARGACGSDPARVLSMYATGHTCSWGEAPTRVAWMRANFRP